MEEIRISKAEYEKILEQLATLQAMVTKMTAIIEEKDQIILNLNRARFGQSSEKRAYVLSDGQTSLFDQAGDGNRAKSAETEQTKEETVTVAAHRRKQKRTLEELCENLPVEKIISDLPEEEKTTADGRPLKYIGTDMIRSELVREPGRVFKREYWSKVYADPIAETETGHADIHKAPTPAPLLPHSYASGSIVTDVIVKKFADALPLYRQEQIWKRQGIDLKRGTLANWVIQASEIYLKPFSDAFLAELLRQSVIHADETVIQVNKEPGRTATAESRIWAYASSKRAEKQIRCFRYEESRKGACAEKVLKGYGGIVISDGYSGYNLLNKAIRAGCWAHARRKWLEAMPKDATLENSLAAKGLDYCSRLFHLEQEFEKLTDEERRRKRQEKSKSIADEYYKWLEGIFRPVGKLQKAIVYSLNQKPYLLAFLDHGEIEISNNQVENAIRPVVVGRKNWLFCDTQAGASATATVFTLIETAKANGLNPESYLDHLLSILPQRFADDSRASIEDLLPWKQEIKNRFLIR